MTNVYPQIQLQNSSFYNSSLHVWGNIPRLQLIAYIKRLRPTNKCLRRIAVQVYQICVHLTLRLTYNNCVLHLKSVPLLKHKII